MQKRIIGKSSKELQHFQYVPFDLWPLHSHFGPKVTGQLAGQLFFGQMCYSLII